MFLSLVLMNAMFFLWRFVLSAETPPPEPVNTTKIATTTLADETITLLEEAKSKTVVVQSLAASSTDQSLSSSSEAASEMPVKSRASSSVSSVSSVSGVSVLPKDTVHLPVKDTAVVDELCYWVGAFASETDRDVIVKRLKDLKISVNSTATSASGELRYWVYLPAQSSPAETLSLVNKLKKLRIENYVISNGAHKGAISLGLFSQKVSADEKILELKRQGWNPELDVFERGASRYWLSANKKDVDAIGAKVLSVMIKNKTNIEINEKKCR